MSYPHPRQGYGGYGGNSSDSGAAGRRSSYGPTSPTRHADLSGSYNSNSNNNFPVSANVGSGQHPMYGSAPIALQSNNRSAGNMGGEQHQRRGSFSYQDQEEDHNGGDSSYAGSPLSLRSPEGDDYGSLSGSLRGNTANRDNSNFKVVIRVRPPVPRELEGTRPFTNVVRIPADHRSITLCEHLDTDDGRGGGIYSKQSFTFDYAYDQETKQQDLYQRSAQPAVLSVLQGYNATLMAYGQTGTGKTYTMEGFTSEERRGIIPRCIEEIFSYIDSCRHRNMKFLVRASYMQIYNEVISDLLKPSAANKQLVVRHTQQRGVYVEGLSEWIVRTPSDVYGLMERGTSLRATSTTRMSELSSRSHAMFIVIVEVMEGDENNPSSYRFGKLNIVDLAGSEKVRQAGVTGQRLEETKNINRSLHELGNVISALASKGRKDKHIPFRNSSLTSALRDSLGGNCKTTFIACISPALESYTESLSTLVFANRAKNIKNNAVINEDLDQATLLRKYERELKLLRSQLEEREATGALAGSLIDPDMVSELEQGKRRAEEDREAALEALEETSRAHHEELLVRQRLEDRIRELEVVVNGGSAKGGPKTSDEYALRLDELDKERQAMEEDKAQVDRYKQLLLKQRDIMLNLTTRLNERDETILHLQEEIDAYDAHIQVLEEALDAANAVVGSNTNGGGGGGNGPSTSSNGMTRYEAQEYLSRRRVHPSGAAGSDTRYRSDLDGTQLLTPEEKILELLMRQRPVVPSAAHPMNAANTNNNSSSGAVVVGGGSGAASGAASSDVRSMQLILRERVESLAQQELEDRYSQFRHELDVLRTRLLSSEDARRQLQYLLDSASGSNNDSVNMVRQHIQKEQEALKTSYSARILSLQQELQEERDRRRQVAREVDHLHFDISQLKQALTAGDVSSPSSQHHHLLGGGSTNGSVNSSSINNYSPKSPMSRGDIGAFVSQLDGMWNGVQQLEKELRREISVKLPKDAHPVPTASNSGGNAGSASQQQQQQPSVNQQQLERQMAALSGQHNREREAMMHQMEEKDRYVRQLESERQTAVSSKEKELASITKSLNTHIKDRKALKTILESRIKVKVDSISELLNSAGLDKQRLAHETRSLQNLVNASISAMEA